MTVEMTEEQARQVEAGPGLDRICAKWVERPDGWIDAPYGGRPKPFSTDWSAAGPLQVAMNARVSPCKEGWSCTVGGLYQPRVVYVVAPTPQLAIARACAVLVACGITQEDLEAK